MQNVGLGLLSIFIPIAIFIFDRKDDQPFKRLDKSVVLDYIIRAPSLLWKIALIFLPLLFWDASTVYVKLAISILWLVGVSLVVEALMNAYTWIRKERFKYRLGYLKEVYFSNELEELWRSVWESIDINSRNEESFFEIFSGHVKALLEKKGLIDLILLSKLLNDFQLFVKQRSYVFLTWPKGVFEKTLEWHYIAWEKACIERDPESKKLHLRTEYYDILEIIDMMIYSIGDKTLKGDKNSSFFISIHKHASKYKDKEIKRHTYPESLIQTFFSLLLSNSETSKNNYDSWKNFPTDWLITYESLDSEQQPIIKVIFETYRTWLQNRLMSQPSGKLDFILENVSKELFPNADPFFLATIMTLCHRTWYGESRIKALIDVDRSFGLFGKITTGVVKSEKDIADVVNDRRNNDLDSTARFVLKLLPAEFSEKIIKNYITELGSFNYASDDHRESYRLEVLDYMKRLLVAQTALSHDTKS